VAKKEKTPEEREEETLGVVDTDPFEDFIGLNEEIKDPDDEVEEAEEADASNQGGEEEAESASSAEEGEIEDGDEEEIEDGDEEPDVKTLEDRERENEELEKENVALRRKMFATREKERVRKEDARLAAIKEEGEEPEIDAEEVGRWDEESGKFVLDQNKLAEKMAAHRERRQGAAREGTTETYDQLRASIIEDLPEADRDQGTKAADELEGAYTWLNSQVEEFCKEAELNPGSIGGMPGLMTLLTETGIIDEFEAKYDDISVVELITAPADPRIMRRTLRNHMRRRVSSDVTDYKEEGEADDDGEGEITKPPHKSRPRPHARRGKSRRASESTTLTDVAPESIFDMSDEEYAEYERRSLKKLDRVK